MPFKPSAAIAAVSLSAPLMMAGAQTVQPPAAADLHKKPGIQVRYDHIAGCTQFITPDSDCTGSRDRLSVTFRNNVTLSYKKGSETAARTYFDRSVAMGDKGSVRGVGEWGFALRDDYQLGLDVGWQNFKIGVYGGHMTGDAHLNNSITAKTVPFDVNTPAFSIPAIPQIGFAGRDIGPHTINVPGIDRELIGDHRAVNRSTYYGGLRQASGMNFEVTPNTHVLLGQSLRGGIDRCEGSLNLGVVTGSHTVNPKRLPLGDFENGAMYLPEKGYAFSAHAIVSKRFYDPFYRLEVKKTNQIADRVNGMIASTYDKVEDKTGYHATPPQYSGERVREILGIVNPMRPQTALRLEFAQNTGYGTVGVSYTLPIGAKTIIGPRAQLTYVQEFN